MKRRLGADASRRSGDAAALSGCSGSSRDIVGPFASTYVLTFPVDLAFVNRY